MRLLGPGPQPQEGSVLYKFLLETSLNSLVITGVGLGLLS